MKSKVFLTIALLSVLVLIVVACAPAPTATPIPPTAAPKPASSSASSAPASSASSSAAPASSASSSAPAPTAVPPTAVPPTKAASSSSSASSVASSSAAATGPAGTIRSILPTGCMQGPIWSTCGARIDEITLPGLVMVKWTGDAVQPMLAESWKTTDGGQTWTFNLRKNVKWSDGVAFNADDVVFSLNLYANPAVAAINSSKLADVKGYKEFYTDKTAKSLSGVTKVDDYTVKVEMIGPRPVWVDLALLPLSILPEHILGKVDVAKLQNDPYWTEKRVGTGPFMWSKYVADQSIELVANPDYFLGKPKADRFIFQIYADIPSRLNALVAGEVDIMSFEGGGIPLNELDRMKKASFLTVLDNLNAGLPTYLQFNFAKDFLKDVRVRQALVVAIDREKILSTIRKAGTISNSLFPQEWALAKDLNLNKYDPAKAKQLLADAKWDANRKVDFIYYYNDSVNVDTVTAIQSYLAAVGVQIVPRYLTPAQINQVYADGTFEMGYFATGIGLDPSLASTVATCGATIAVNYCNKTVDDLFSKGMTGADRTTRAPYYQQISKILNDEMFRGFLWYDVRPLAFNNRIPAVADHFKQMPNLIFNNPVYMEQEKWEVK